MLEVVLPSPPLSRCLQVLQKDIHDVKFNYVSFFICTLHFKSSFFLFGINEDFAKRKIQSWYSNKQAISSLAAERQYM
jgi:hypothetical protein